MVELVSNDARQWNFADLIRQPASGSAQPVTLSLLQVEDAAVVVVSALACGQSLCAFGI